MQFFIQKFFKLVVLIVSFSAMMVNADCDKDVKAGEQFYTQCIGCHAPDYNRTGPKHCGIVGRKAGGVNDFVYTGAMKKSGIIWTRETLNQFLISPLKMIPGTSMGFSGIADKQKRQQLISYIIQLDENNVLCQ